MTDFIKKEHFLEEISKKDFDKKHFVKLLNTDGQYRNISVEEMLTNDKIMIYYNCFLVVDELCRLYPKMYIDKWEKFSELLNHKNSYKRDFALTLIANLIIVDEKKNFNKIVWKYLDHVYDRKFMTAECCVKNIGRILANRRDLTDGVLTFLINWKKKSPYKEKQAALMDCFILQILEQFYNNSMLKSEINRFIIDSDDSLSPKTRKKARQLIKKFGLQNL